MTVAEVLEQVKALSIEERRELMTLLDRLEDMDSAPPRKRSILELRGLGKEIWEGVDVEAYINELRDDGDDLP